MTDPGYIVVIGYCHDSETDLSSLVPDELIKLCCLYWSQKVKIVIRSNDQFQYLDLGSKQLSTFNKLQKSMDAKNCCYFNANSFQIDDNLLYDGIIGITKIQKQIPSQMYYWRTISIQETYLSIALFASNDTQSGQINYKLFTSRKPLLNEIDQFLACGDNGIVYSFKNSLYQLKLSDIDVINEKFSFINYPLTLSESCKWSRNCSRTNLTYLSRQNKIICMLLKCTDTRHRYMFTYMFPVFDVDSGYGDWDCKYICDFKCQQLYNRNSNIDDVNIAAQICEDEYDVNMMYVVFQNGSVLKYNFSKNKWVIVMKNKKKNRGISLKDNFVVWMDNYQVLACGDGEYFGRLDLRRNKLQWQRIKDIKCS
eukprot:150439_1